MDSAPVLQPSVRDELISIAAQLDELLIDPQCDDLSAEEIARTLGILGRVMDETLRDAIATTNRLMREPLPEPEPDDECLAEYLGQFPKIFANCFRRLGMATVFHVDSGNETESALCAGMALAFKSIALALSKTPESAAGWAAIEVWSGMRDDDVPGSSIGNLTNTRIPPSLFD